jgi:preprotein translocase subunit SecG
MNIIIWLLTFVLVINCLLLILLVLIQLPKKEAGLGQAFGGGATDALFGAGSGNALTKLTKYAAGAFFVLTLAISMLHGRAARSGATDLRETLTATEKLPLGSPAPAAVAATNAPAAAAVTNVTVPTTNKLTLDAPAPETAPAPQP